jgi:peptidyl-prolyl cis-trans isomerase C
MKEFYNEHKDEFKTPEMWRASHILVADEKDAKSILDELARGAKFEDLAVEHSIDATASRGGDIGFFRAGQLVPDFEKACLKLNAGQTSDIVRTQFGYHVIRLTDKKEPGVKSYEDARRAIEAEIIKQKRSELFNALMLKLKNKYGVEVDEDAFAEGAVPVK